MLRTKKTIDSQIMKRANVMINRIVPQTAVLEIKFERVRGAGPGRCATLHIRLFAELSHFGATGRRCSLTVYRFFRSQHFVV